MVIWFWMMELMRLIVCGVSRKRDEELRVELGSPSHCERPLRDCRPLASFDEWGVPLSSHRHLGSCFRGNGGG